MQRTVVFGLVAAGLLAGCARQAPGPHQVAVPPDDASNGPPIQFVGGPAALPPAKPLDAFGPSKQERCQNSLIDALNLLAQKKQDQALAAFEAAKESAREADGDVDSIQEEIDRLKDGMDRQAAAEAAVQNIRAVLDAGRADEAARLAADALAQYGGSDAADDLLKLKREADALAAALGDAAAHRRAQRDEAKADLEANNLRAAAVALEQASQPGADDDLKKQLDDVHDRLSRYDDGRRRAEELRRDPSNLDDAVAALQDAQKAWDTFEVRQQIAEYQLALQNRRDRLGVADLEVGGDVGLADAGRTLADELLPAFKSRFDLAERGQLNQVIGELKLEATDLNGGANQAEVGRLAKVRYLVVGSVTRLSGVTVNARLVDVRSGLVVQTARVSAPTAEDLLPLLPQLATVLMMTDEQKLAYEQQLTQQAAAAPPPAPVDATPLPPPPDVQPDAPPPAPLVTAASLPPPPGAVSPDDFQNLPPPPPPDQPPPVVVADPPDATVKLRLRHVTIELGDNLFRRGRFREAQVQFDLALNAGCDRGEVEVRLDRCRPFLPPPPPPEIVVVAPPPPPRPRLAILDLAVIGDPDVVPPALGPWTADNLAPYFCANYDIVDRETVCWYMNRLGLSLRDVLTDPVARRWLGRALGVRFFVLGDVRQTASFVVTTHLVDAECGYAYGEGRLHVHDPFELRLRLGDLAAQTLLDPAERRRRQDEAEAAERERQRLGQMADAERLHALQESQNVPLLVVEAQKIGDGGDLSVSIELLGRARKLRPDDVEVNVLFDRFNEKRRRHDWEEQQKRQWEQQQAGVAAAQQQQLALARAVEEARLQAAQAAAAQQAAGAQALEAQRQQAFLQLQAQAQLALQQQQFNQAVQLCQTALAIRQTDEGYRALAEARARADEAARLAAAQAAAQQDAALRQQRESELARARQQLEEQHRQQEAREKAARDAQAARDQAYYQGQLDAAKAQIAKQQYDAAVASLQTARQMRRTEEADRLLAQAQAEQAQAAAKGAAAQAELAGRLVEEKTRREKAEAEAAHNRDLYEQALKLAQKALADKNYDMAEAKYNEAGKVYSTDVVLTGLRSVKEARGRAAADQAKRDAEAKKDAEFHRLSDAGTAALEAKQFDRAVKLLNDANQMKPGDVTVLTALGKAEHEQADAAARAQHDAETARQEATFRQTLAGGKANLAAKQYDAAVVALKEAARLKPGDPEAAAALQQAEKAQADAALTAEQQAQAKKKMDAYQKSMADGRAALSAKQYDAAAAAFGEAQKLLPGDAVSAEFLKQAQKTKADAGAAAADAAKKHQEEQERAAAVQKALTQARAALAVHDLDAAGKAVAAAADKAPNDPDVKKVQLDLQTASTAAKAAADQAAAKKAADDLAAKTAADKAAAMKAAADKAAADQAAAKKAADDLAAKAAADKAAAMKAAADKAATDKAAAMKAAADQAAAKKAADDLAAKTAADKAAKEAADKAKKQQADYALAMGAGKAAVQKGDYTGAANAYSEALRIMPGDKDAATALQGAQQAQAAMDADAKRKADEKAKQDAAMAAAKAAAEAAKKAAEAKRQADFAADMKAGRDALAAKKYADAAKAFTDADKIQPGDKDAAAGMKAAQDAAAADEKAKQDAAMAAAKAAAAAEAAKKAEEAKRQADFAADMKAGRDALAAKKYADAAKAFTDAGKAQPGDKDAAAGLKAAQDGAAADEKAKQDAAMAAAKAAAAAEAAKKAAEAKRQADFANLVTQGQTALGGKKYDDAAKAFTSALQLQPGDAKATTGLQNAQFGQHMTQGQSLSAAKKYAEAAKEFDAALAILPDNPDAKAALKRAKNNMP